VDQGGLWFKHVTSKYSTNGSRVKRDGKKASLWWKDLSEGVKDGGEGCFVERMGICLVFWIKYLLYLIASLFNIYFYVNFVFNS
jgi:hypothetical protein